MKYKNIRLWRFFNFNICFLIFGFFIVNLSFAENINGWLLFSRNSEEIKTSYWSKYFNYHKPNTVFTYNYEMPAILDNPSLNLEAHGFDDSLLKRNILWYVYSVPDIIEKENLPQSPEEWQVQRDKYQELFLKFPSIKGVVMNWYNCDAARNYSNKKALVEAMVRELKPVFEPGNKKLLFRFYRFIYSSDEVISVFGGITGESWAGCFPKETDSDFGVFHGHSPVLEKLGPDNFVVGEFDLNGEAWCLGRLTWIPVPSLRKSRAFFNKWGIKGGVPRVVFQKTGSDAGLEKSNGSPFNLHEINYSAFNSIMGDTGLQIPDGEIYDEYLYRRFGFGKGSELSSVIGQAIGRSYFTLVKAAWTEPLARETPSLMPDNDWGAIYIAGGSMTAQRARFILQEKEDSWQMAQATWNELLSVKDGMDPASWEVFRQNIYRNYLISMSARFEAEARVELLRAQTAGQAPNWPTVKYAIERLKEMKAGYETIEQGYTDGKYNAAIACISENEPKIPGGTVAALARGPYLFNKSWIQTGLNELILTWESQVPGKSFIEYCEDTTGWISGFSFKATSMTGFSSTSHRIVLGGLGQKSCYFFRMVTVGDNGDIMRSSEFYYTLLNATPSSAFENTRKPELFSSTLFKISPNPCFSEASMHFIVPWNGRVRVRVYTPQGRLVHSLINNNFQKGEYKVIWSAGEKCAGNYLIYFAVGDQRTVSKLVLVK
ncbi:MAG: T9SS type A sorting domain-containing protein [bacterium]